MANPNLSNVSSILGNTAVVLAGATATTVVSNAAASGTVVKVEGLYCSNVDATTTYNVTIDLFRSSTAYNVATNVSIPVGATLDILSKSLYLLEGDTLRATGSAANKISVVCSYEVMS